MPVLDTAAVYEQTHVHAIYEAIASHFSATRHKPWPLVSWFLNSRTPGSLGYDLGCGNGKYLSVNDGVVLVGSDRSTNLVKLATERTRFRQTVVVPLGKEKGKKEEVVPAVAGADVVVADSLVLPFMAGSGDFAVSIAVIHHFATKERRCTAVRAILETLKPRGNDMGAIDSARLEIPEGVEVNERAGTDVEVRAGEALIYVWALEQRGSRRGWDEGVAQDQLVPWVTKGKAEKKGEDGEDGEAADKTVHRYYHLYRKGELEEDVRAIGGEVVTSGYERDNWWVVCRRGVDFMM